eukprot:TRINITY_DN4842_c0_g1_i5.p2 TRINITY_DN4842_c0_g1~~TRINITY_DN4842_c0_g1_i5.p2  ORF type:complete len:113 (-),score=24.09 TRINITY_DN4842_c0_g1_i5:556-894(-)
MRNVQGKKRTQKKKSLSQIRGGKASRAETKEALGGLFARAALFGIRIKSVASFDLKRLEEIGSDAFGKVYKGMDANTMITYALKVMRFKVGDDDNDDLAQLVEEITLDTSAA